MKKIMEFYNLRRKHYIIGLAIHVVGGLILAIVRNSVLPLILLLFAFILWFGYDYLNYNSKQDEDDGDE